MRGHGKNPCETPASPISTSTAMRTTARMNNSSLWRSIMHPIEARDLNSVVSLR